MKPFIVRVNPDGRHADPQADPLALGTLAPDAERAAVQVLRDFPGGEHRVLVTTPGPLPRLVHVLHCISTFKPNH